MSQTTNTFILPLLHGGMLKDLFAGPFRFDAQAVAAGDPPEAILPLYRNPDGSLGTLGSRAMGKAPETK